MYIYNWKLKSNSLSIQQATESLVQIGELTQLFYRSTYSI